LTIRHHPHDETLLAYAAGTLLPPLAALIVCHLAYCARCRAEVRRMELIGGALLEREEQRQELSGKAVDRMLDRLSEIVAEAEAGTDTVEATPDGVLPMPLARHLGATIDDIPWRELTPGVEQFRVKMPPRSGELRVLRVQAGKKLLRHGHYGSELTLVLKGTYRDETGEYHVGEVADLDEEPARSTHATRASRSGCCAPFSESSST
jgi:putative transcriptional regulator